MAPSTQQPRQGVLKISGLNSSLRIATVNVDSMRGRSREVVAMLGRRRVEVCSVQEVRYSNGGTKIYGSDNEKYKFWWSGGGEGRAGVRILVKEEWVESVIEVIRWDDRMMKIKLVVGEKVLNIFSVYAPRQGRPDEEKEEVREKLSDIISEVSRGDIVIVAGDINAHIGRDNGWI
ncbi:hypothetical protein Pcinc_018434 [Petrolisthes cinctipes]|uniref:Endonuclease/exonuclease/phosphatase domain-containing protein n=1 Tax=Petrolisthes cinctipes TaxID=88211 RepID=A0AAE1KLL9_PETCI|nr:hypothetical protein Pcinc_018434 [Petrolisthes cinctipes]